MEKPETELIATTETGESQQPTIGRHLAQITQLQHRPTRERAPDPRLAHVRKQYPLATRGDARRLVLTADPRPTVRYRRDGTVKTEHDA